MSFGTGAGRSTRNDRFRKQIANRPKSNLSIRRSNRPHYPGFIYVYAWGMVTPHRKYVVFVGFRRQRRRRNGSIAVHTLLSPLRAGRLGRSDRDRHEQYCSDGGRIWGHRWGHGCVCSPLPSSSRSNTGLSWFLHHDTLSSRVFHSCLVVRCPACLRTTCARTTRRRRRLLGAHRWLSRRHLTRHTFSPAIVTHRRRNLAKRRRLFPT